MAEIGNFGSLITFKVSDKKVLTFKNISRTVKGRWATHERIGRKPLVEFLGPDLQSLTLPIHLDAHLGVRPLKVIKSIESDIEDGEAHSLVIGGSKIGKRKWRIVEMSETRNVIYDGGELAAADIDLKLEEYE